MLSARNQVFLFQTFILPLLFAPILLLPLGPLFSDCPQHPLTLAMHLVIECPTDDRQIALRRSETRKCRAAAAEAPRYQIICSRPRHQNSSLFCLVTNHKLNTRI